MLRPRPLDTLFMQYYFRKKFFKIIFLFHKFFTKTTRPLKGFYDIYLTPAYHDKTFEYCFKGTYGTQFSDFLANITDELFFLDIGANQGLYSVLAGKNPAVKKIFSFEPNQVIVPRLINNLKINQIHTSEIIPAAISNQTGELTLNTVEGHSGKSSLRTVKQENKTTSKVKIIQTINHEELNKRNFFKQTQWIFCEIDEKWINPENIYRLLRKEGFTCFERIGNHPTHYDVMMRR